MSEEATLRDKWVKRLAMEEAAHKTFRDEAKCAMHAYMADKESNEPYPLFWSTVKVLHGRIYAQPPRPDVRKRYQDEAAKQMVPGQQPMPGQQPQTIDDNRLAQCIERALTYTIDTTAFDADGHAAVNDFIVTGLGQAKVEMETKTGTVPVINPLTREPIIGKDGKPVTQTVIVSQKVKLRAFAWSQFRWEPNQHWSQVGWVAFDHWMTADEIRDEFGTELIQSQSQSGEANPAPDKPDAAKYAALYRVSEIWDKKSRRILFVTDAHAEILENREDKLGLEEFFPCPKPMMLNVKDDDLVPKPDYSYCQQLFTHVNTLTSRIFHLTKQVRDVGFYDAAFGELAELVTRADGDLIPIDNLAARIEAIGQVGKSGYDAIVAKQDNGPKAEVIQQLMGMREAAKANIWETYGIADIQRGSTDPDETATAQRIKADWANVRVGERIRIVALFMRDVFRLMAEIIAEHFQPQQLFAMTGIELSQQEMETLRSDLGRCYAIDVESDSTVVQDEAAQKEQRLEFLNTVTEYIKQILPAIQQNAMPADLAKELLLYAVNTFKGGRQLEDAINALPGTAQQLSGLNRQLQQGQQQTQQLQQQLQEQGKQLQQVNAQEEQRENIKTGSEAQLKGADTQRTQVETMLLAEQVRGTQVENAQRQVLGPLQ